MERIKAILTGSITEEQKIENKLGRINNAIQAAKLNIDTDLMSVNDRIVSAIEKSNDMEASELIQKLGEIIQEKHDIEDANKCLDEVVNYLYEDIKTEKKK